MDDMMSIINKLLIKKYDTFNDRSQNVDGVDFEADVEPIEFGTIFDDDFLENLSIGNIGFN